MREKEREIESGIRGRMMVKWWGDFLWRTAREGRQLRNAGWATYDGARKGIERS